MVEEVEDTLLERQAGPEDRGDHERGVAGRDTGDTEGGDDVFLGVGEFLGEFIGKDLADAFEIGPETETVFLDGGIPHLCDEIVENRRVLTEIDNFHGVSNMVTSKYKYRNLFRFANPFILE